ncbi:MAG: hypothetical protein PHF60_01595 [Candidatus ainarchaeum sp.]|nr:hypothetical protein [Candidatus ainarchaeum sp.]
MAEKNPLEFRERGHVDVHAKPHTEALKAEARTWAFNYTVTASNDKTYVLSCRYSLGSNDSDRQKNLASMLNSATKSKDLSVTSGGDVAQFKKDFFAGSQTVIPPEPRAEKYTAYAEIVPLEVKTVKKQGS